LAKEDIVMALVVIIALVLIIVGVLPLLQQPTPTPTPPTPPPGTSVTYTSYTIVAVAVLILVPGTWWYIKKKGERMAPTEEPRRPLRVCPGCGRDLSQFPDDIKVCPFDGETKLSWKE